MSGSLFCGLLVASLVAVVLVPPASAVEAPGPQQLASVEGITEYRFANGLRLLLFPDPASSRVTVNMTVLVGSRHEGYGESGMAHLLEHMVFKGTPTHPNIPKLLQDHGARFNGTTSLDRTNYFETLPATDENLEFAIRLEADRLVHSHIKKEDLESEFTVVRNEFESGENSPLSVLYKRISAAAYEWHNYGKSTIGNRSDIERVPIENLRAFYRKYYQPDNVIVVIAGQFREARALELVGKYFGTLPKPERTLSATYTVEPPQDGERNVVLRRVGDVAAVGMAYHIPAGSHADSPPLQILANILATQPSGRLYRALVETKQATNLFASARALHDPGLFLIQATAREPELLEDVRTGILSLIESLDRDPITEEEVNRARVQILKARELAATDTSQLAVSLSEWAAMGDWRLYFLHRDRIERVSASDVQRVAGTYLRPNNRTVGVFIPTEKPERITVPEKPNMADLVANYQGRAAVAAGETFDPSPGNIESRVQRLTLDEAIQVTLLPKKSRGEEVHLSLTLRYGNLDNLQGRNAAADLLGPLLSRGTRQLTYQQLRDELDKLTATLSTGGGGRRGPRGGGGPPGAAGAVGISIQAKRATLPAVLRLLQQVLREPSLPADQFEILKGERLTDLEEGRNDPATLASIALRRHFAPYASEDVRYVPTVDEALARLKTTRHEDVVSLYREYLGSQAGELVIVGDFDAQECLPILQETFRGWRAAQSYARIETPYPDGVKAVREQIRTPDKANAIFASGQVIKMRDEDPDYPALLIANFIYGGSSLASRLGTRVRQREGLSYGVGSVFTASPFEPRAALSVNAICNPENIDKVNDAVQEEFRRLIQNGITEEELKQSRTGFLQAQRIARSTDAGLVGLLGTLSYTGRTMDYQAQLEEKIGTLTASMVNEALRRHFDPDRASVITAGDFK